MSRKVFFSFQFKRDAWRAGQVRNSNLLADEDEYGFIDSVAWEKVEREGHDAVKRWIDDQLKYTSVTVVLVGAQTAESDWVDYEIRESWERGNALLVVRIHNVKDQEQKTDVAGSNPLDNVRLVDGKPISSFCETYDWVTNNGRSNLGTWVENAFQARAAYKGETKLLEADSESTNKPADHLYEAGPTIIKNPSAPWAR